jgi:hypothetical protein
MQGAAAGSHKLVAVTDDAEDEEAGRRVNAEYKHSTS